MGPVAGSLAVLFLSESTSQGLMDQSVHGGHHVNWTGPGTASGLAGLSKARISLELPGATPLIVDTAELKGAVCATSPVHHSGTRVTFQDVDYFVKNQANSKEKLKILSQVSGFFNPGEMAAVMGPSGSGEPGAALMGAFCRVATVGRQLQAIVHMPNDNGSAEVGCAMNGIRTGDGKYGALNENPLSCRQKHNAGFACGKKNNRRLTGSHPVWWPATLTSFPEAVHG